jgi:pimeloyl-ACP methyl ester carboxylesterase
MKLSEQAVLLGERKSMAGIFTQAAGTAAPADNIALVILNSGIIHRVGHHRMYVTFSRALAAEGYTVLRFDLSGLGDSENRADGLPPLESSLADLKEVLDWLETIKHAKRMILIGLCSGADSAVLYATTDPRVVGLVLMDPLIPPTPRYIRDYLRRRVFKFRSWLNVAFGPSRVRRMLIERLVGALAKNWQPRNPTLAHPNTRSQLERIYRTSVDRGVQFLVVLTGDHPRQTYAEQLLEAFPNVPFFDHLRLEFFDDSDHSFTSEAARGRLLRLILDWLRETNFRHAAMINTYLIAAKVLDDMT